MQPAPSNGSFGPGGRTAQDGPARRQQLAEKSARLGDRSRAGNSGENQQSSANVGRVAGPTGFTRRNQLADQSIAAHPVMPTSTQGWAFGPYSVMIGADPAGWVNVVALRERRSRMERLAT